MKKYSELYNTLELYGFNYQGEASMEAYSREIFGFKQIVLIEVPESIVGHNQTGYTTKHLHLSYFKNVQSGERELKTYKYLNTNDICDVYEQIDKYLVEEFKRYEEDEIYRHNQLTVNLHKRFFDEYNGGKNIQSYLNIKAIKEDILKLRDYNEFENYILECSSIYSKYLEDHYNYSLIFEEDICKSFLINFDSSVKKIDVIHLISSFWWFGDSDSLERGVAPIIYLEGKAKELESLQLERFKNNFPIIFE